MTEAVKLLNQMVYSDNPQQKRDGGYQATILR